MNNKMVSREILNSHPIAHLRAEVKKTNVNLTSKMTKSEIIELMMKHSSRFSHITMMEKPKKEKPPPKEKKKAEPKEKKKAEPKKKEKPPPKKDTEKERRDEMNAMSPMELFGQLPPELRGKIGDTAVAMNEKDKKDKNKKDQEDLEGKIKAYVRKLDYGYYTRNKILGDYTLKSITKKNIILEYGNRGRTNRFSFQEFYDRLSRKEQAEVRSMD